MTTMAYDEWQRLLNKGEAPNGFSPGGAAAEIGVTRQAIMKAIQTGRLDATRVKVPLPNIGHLWLIDPADLKAFQKKRLHPPTP